MLGTLRMVGALCVPRLVRFGLTGVSNACAPAAWAIGCNPLPRARAGGDGPASLSRAGGRA